MEIIIRNIGKIKSAEIAVDGIAVVAGENNMGKSTISKSLYAAFNCHYDINRRIISERRHSIEEQLFRVLYRKLHFHSPRIRTNIVGECARIIVDNALDNYDDIFDTLTEHFGSLDNFEENDLRLVSEHILEDCKVSDEELYKTIVNRFFDAEFSGQINNVFTDEPGVVQLKIKDNVFEFVIDKNRISNDPSIFDMYTRAIYIDDPFVIDDLENGMYRERFGSSSHREALIKLLRRKQDSVVLETIATQKAKKLIEIVDTICDGAISIQREPTYQFTGTEEELQISNLSAGLKTFVIVKTLIENGGVEENGTLILDEPEIHLHPEWQLVLAELIVLLQKDFGMHILLNTHSPYFMRALQVYSAIHGIAVNCTYYLAKEEDGMVTFDDVTTAPERIYQKLAMPFQKLEDIEYGKTFDTQYI